MLLITLTCGSQVEFDDGQPETTEIEACPDCSALIHKRLAADADGQVTLAKEGGSWERVRATMGSCKHTRTEYLN